VKNGESRTCNRRHRAHEGKTLFAGKRFIVVARSTFAFGRNRKFRQTDLNGHHKAESEDFYGERKMKTKQI